jgi:ABC-type phosphate transport system permease subunit
VTVADPAIIAGLVFAWGTLSARLERSGMTAPIVFTAAGVQTWPSRQPDRRPT